MNPGCLANSAKRSTKWLPENMNFNVYFVEILVSEDYLYDRNLGKVVCQMNAVMFAIGVISRSSNAIHIY